VARLNTSRTSETRSSDFFVVAYRERFVANFVPHSSSHEVPLSVFACFLLATCGGPTGPRLFNCPFAFLAPWGLPPRMSHEHDEYSCIMYELKDVCSGYHELLHVCTFMALDFRIHSMLHPRRSPICSGTVRPSFAALVSSFRHPIVLLRLPPCSVMV
jgi:hypothetical protein